MRQVYKKYFDVFVFVLILAMIIRQLVRLGENPGLYLDAINPDYIAVQLLYPREGAVKWQIAWPWLCQVYHGNVGILITLVSTWITGSTGVLQYHITYGILSAVCVFLLYRILKSRQLGIKREWAAAAVCCLAASPSLLTIIITQYYMSLFGTMCILGGILLFFGWMEQTAKRRKLLVCYFLFGLAFYSYFNFLFFLPSLVIATVYILKKEHTSWKCLADRVITGGIAYMSGCGFYIAGYSQIALFHAKINMNTTKIIGLSLGVFFLLGILFLLFYKKMKYRYVVLSGYGILAVVWLGKVLPAIVEAAKGLEVMGKSPSTLWQKVQTICGDYGCILSGRYAESMIYGCPVTVYNTHLLRGLAVLVIVTVLMELLSKEKIRQWKITAMIMGIFFICSLAFGTRMQPQHYVPLLFFTAGLVVLCIKSVCQCVHRLTIHSGRKNRRQKFLIPVVLCIFCIQLSNQNAVIRQIRSTGGEGMWSAEMTALAKNAVENKKKGIEEVYVFYEWGFMTGFNYLTKNDITIVADWDLGALSQYYNDKKDIIICYWKKKKENTNRTILDLTANFMGEIKTEAIKNKNKEIQFYKMTLFHSEGQR